MALVLTNIIPSKIAESTSTTQYTSTSAKTLITKFTGTNIGSSNVTVTVHLIANGGLVGDSNSIAFERVIAPSETYLFPEIIGHSLEPSGFIVTDCDLPDSLVIRATGQVIT